MMDKVSPGQNPDDDDLIGSIGFGGFLYAHIEFETESEEAEVAPENDSSETDFSEYLWMENEEEFDKTEMLRLEEQWMEEECIEAMMHDELLDQPSEDWSEESELAEQSTLNPLANEFVPVSY